MPPAGSDPALPAVEPFPLPFLGTSWVHRGFRYGVRRGLLVLTSLLFVAVVGATGTALYLGFVSLFPPGARVAVHAVEGAAALAALVAGWVRQRPVNRVPVTPEQVAESRRRAGRAAARSYGNQGFAVLMTPVLPALAAYLLGGFLAALLVRETPREIGARQDYERRVAEASRQQERQVHRDNARRAPRNGPTRR
ncbi:hypothetical protein NMG29_18765 [Streptomyces cocklensis]|uniref:Uncharacterized protein n=1 Tax=Actinacidiphila cocklensis TaxID=887465 RepID=A0A9W4DVH9_9ACTN|nr:hypothetical protein [Actinacidiphila cocklensis]MDD1060216.1 hypothetical protein [Actinacidiphila cocklensis]CAG6394300.1 conserved hypothetical protein [Actinacidiphila cocklensis]